jgi:hypothetical protein
MARMGFWVRMDFCEAGRKDQDEVILALSSFFSSSLSSLKLSAGLFKSSASIDSATVSGRSATVLGEALMIAGVVAAKVESLIMLLSRMAKELLERLWKQWKHKEGFFNSKSMIELARVTQPTKECDTHYFSFRQILILTTSKYFLPADTCSSINHENLSRWEIIDRIIEQFFRPSRVVTSRGAHCQRIKNGNSGFQNVVMRFEMTINVLTLFLNSIYESPTLSMSAKSSKDT